MSKSLAHASSGTSSNGPVTILLVGAGMRGNVYAEYALLNPTKARVIAVADPNKWRRESFARRHQIPLESQYERWEDVPSDRTVADAVIIGTMDHLHAPTVEKFSRLGYNILCEKPMATSIPDCAAMLSHVKRSTMQGKVFAICHVMRYSPYNYAIKEVIDSGVLGDIVDVEHLEPVGNQHFAHSFVRGNWGVEADSTFTLMSKCCHDLDIISFYLSGYTPTSVASHGSLFQFKPSKKPKEAGSAKRCFDCAYEDRCVWSAKKIYLDDFNKEDVHWMTKAVVESEVIDIELVAETLKTSRYGGCVFEAGNDVVDHQTVLIEYDSGTTVSLTMSAFSESECERKTRISGTKGELIGNMESFTVFDFLTREKKTYKPEAVGVGHGGGDESLSQVFVEAVAKGDQSLLGVTADEVFNSHMLVFAAEKSRRERQMVDYAAFRKDVLSGQTDL